MRKRELASRLIVARREIESLEDRVNQLEHEIRADLRTVQAVDNEATIRAREVYYKEEERITLSGKVDKIIEHLGLNITVAQKKCTPAKVVVSKVKKKARK